MDTYGDSPTAGRPEQNEIPERPSGPHQITHAQEATLREMFGIQLRRPRAGQGLEPEQAAQVGHGTTIK